MRNINIKQVVGGANPRFPVFLLIEASQPLFKAEPLQPYSRVGEECVTCLGSQKWQYCNVSSVSTVVPADKCHALSADSITMCYLHSRESRRGGRRGQGRT